MTSNSYTINIKTPCGGINATVNLDSSGNIERTFIEAGNRGSWRNISFEALSRQIGLSLRYNIPIAEIVGELRGFVCTKAKHAKDFPWDSCHDLIADILEGWMPEGQKVEDNTPKCPECSDPLVFEGGCSVCKSCGWSACSIG